MDIVSILVFVEALLHCVPVVSIAGGSGVELDILVEYLEDRNRYVLLWGRHDLVGGISGLSHTENVHSTSWFAQLVQTGLFSSHW